MKRVSICVVIGLVAATLSLRSASALPPFNKEWVGKYVTGNPNETFVESAGTAKCNVCHKGVSKKDHNEYGQALKKYVTKDGYNAIKANAAAATKYIIDGLNETEGAKNAAGKTFGERIKAGELPGG